MVWESYIEETNVFQKAFRFACIEFLIRRLGDPHRSTLQSFTCNLTPNLLEPELHGSCTGLVAPILFRKTHVLFLDQLQDEQVGIC